MRMLLIAEQAAAAGWVRPDASAPTYYSRALDALQDAYNLGNTLRIEAERDERRTLNRWLWRLTKEFGITCATAEVEPVDVDWEDELVKLLETIRAEAALIGKETRYRKRTTRLVQAADRTLGRNRREVAAPEPTIWMVT